MGAHFGFHPGYPPHAIAAGADAMVVSAHKNLPAYSQAALALAVTDRLPRHRLEAAFDATNTTSPAGAILASIDASRALLAARGTAMLEQLAGLVGQARQQLLGRCPGLVVPEAADFEAGRFDPAKLVLLLAETGASGIEIETDLEDEGIALEMADPDIVVATVTLADTPETVGRLTEALAAAIQRRRRTPGTGRRPRAGPSSRTP